MEELLVIVISEEVTIDYLFEGNMRLCLFRRGLGRQLPSGYELIS